MWRSGVNGWMTRAIVLCLLAVGCLPNAERDVRSEPTQAHTTAPSPDVLVAVPGATGGLEEPPSAGRLGSTPGGDVYSFNWYAPALGYYANHRWRLLTSSARMARIVGGIDLFAAAGTVRRVPPWPAESFLVAGFPAELDRELPRASRLVARSGELELRVVAP